MRSIALLFFAVLFVFNLLIYFRIDFPMSVVLLALCAILLFHFGRKEKKILVWSLASYLLFYFIEVLGVQSGFPFGSYRYGSALGISLFETPLLIGLLWILIILGIHCVIQQFKWPLASAALIGVLFDIALEILAPSYDLWTFEGFYLQNYLSWAILCFIGVYSLKASKITIQSKTGAYVFLVQFALLALMSMLLLI